MTSFVNINYSTQHVGAARVESAIDAVKLARRGVSGSRGLALLLLSAIVASAMVVADQVMDSVAEGHLLVVWMGLWAVAFAATALFAGAARQLARRFVASLDAWSRNMAQARADARLWETAQSDPRVMADLRAAMVGNEARAELTIPAMRPVGRQDKVATMQPADRPLPAYHRYYI
ncbi:MAG TPA: hypothetical protein VE934_01385 [Polaromonas sp.]|uniref:hypothetical protein n=1 Tax=Polaromonas sp. TaxID=1869339 RepID=UPI002D455DB7|nr:hypothetical protein [Polaromonas sp.]HYW55586.1 hypothetical protein [Polaromonas sp.]